jgi:hypothetical protein
MKTTSIILQINTCKECPFFKKVAVLASLDDDLSNQSQWMCKKEYPAKVISKYVEWHQENKTPVPDWCPIKADDLLNRADVRNKLGPLKNIITMISGGDIQISVKLSELVSREVEAAENSLEYLSGKASKQ